MHSYTLLSSLLLLLIGLTRATPPQNMTISDSSRSKRFVYYTSENRLTLPPGALLVLTPTLQLPVYRNLPVGYGSHMTVSIPFSINFDDLGLTSEENPWALWPDFGIFRKKREAWTGPIPGVNWAGGDRELMFQVLEDALGNVGLPGKPCLLRAICEMFETPLMNHGFVGDVMELFFSVSKASQADKRLAEYLEAETLGKHHKSCSKYYSGCEHSLFSHNGQSKWTRPAKHEDHEDTVKDQEHTKKNSQKLSEENEDPLLGTDEAELLDKFIGNHIEEEQNIEMM